VENSKKNARQIVICRAWAIELFTCSSGFGYLPSRVARGYRHGLGNFANFCGFGYQLLHVAQCYHHGWTFEDRYSYNTPFRD
jgi:hypothetical protein